MSFVATLYAEARVLSELIGGVLALVVIVGLLWWGARKKDDNGSDGTL